MPAVAMVSTTRSGRVDNPVLRDRDQPFRRERQSAAAQILDLVDRHRPGLVTLDVFDTVLWRPCRVPHYLFSTIGEAFRERGLLGADLGAEQFASARRQAESVLRRQAVAAGKSPEIGLIGIYAALAPLFAAETLSLPDLVAIEVAVERQALQPDHTMEQVLHGLKARAIPYAYCSDTYFTATELVQLVSKVDADVDIAQCFSSHEHGTDKSLGLLAIAAHHYGVNPAEILHIGDNVHADIRGAKLVGAHAVHIRQYSAIAPVFFQGEEQAAHLLGLSWRTNAVSCGIDAIRRQAWHEAVGLQYDGDLVDHLGLLTVGPLLAGFAEWTVRQAERQGIRTLLCLTREGLFLSELINLFAISRGADVKAVPFLTSRTVTYPTLFVECDLSEFETFFFSRRTPLTAARFLRKVGREDLVRTIEPELRHLSVVGGEPQGRRVLAMLAADSEIRDAVRSWAQRVQADLGGYVARIAADNGLNIAEPVGFVDLGWTTRSQTVLRRAMERLGWSGGSVGLYLATDAAADRELAQGTRSHGFLFDAGEPIAQSRITLRCKEILEQVCSADIGSVIGYEKDGSILFDDAAPPASQHRFLAQLRNRVRDFCETYIAMKPPSDAPHWSLSGWAPALRVALTRLTTCPSREELDVIGDWIHDENNGSDFSERICDPYFLELVRYATPRQIHDLPVYWVFGLLLLARPEAFDSVISLSRGATSPTHEERSGASLQFFDADVLIEEIIVDYFLSSDQRAISYAAFHHAGPLSLRWANNGDFPITIKRVLIGRRSTENGSISRAIHDPADVIPDAPAYAGSDIVVPAGMSVRVNLPRHDAPCETSLVLCLRGYLPRAGTF